MRIALGGAPLIELARAVDKLDGVRVTGGPALGHRERGYVAHCLGFKMVLSVPAAEDAEFALALVSRAPQAALAVMSELGSVLELLMSEPVQLSEPAPAKKHGIGHHEKDPPDLSSASAPLRRSTLQQGKPLARKTQLQRKTPLARGRFRRT